VLTRIPPVDGDLSPGKLPCTPPFRLRLRSHERGTTLSSRFQHSLLSLTHSVGLRVRPLASFFFRSDICFPIVTFSCMEIVAFSPRADTSFRPPWDPLLLLSPKLLYWSYRRGRFYLPHGFSCQQSPFFFSIQVLDRLRGFFRRLAPFYLFCPL